MRMITLKASGYFYIALAASGYVLAAVTFVNYPSGEYSVAGASRTDSLEAQNRKVGSASQHIANEKNSGNVGKSSPLDIEKLVDYMSKATGGRVDPDSVNLLHDILMAKPGEINKLLDRALYSMQDLPTKVLFLREFALYPEASARLLAFAKQEASSENADQRLAAVQIASGVATNPSDAQSHKALSTMLSNEKDPVVLREMLGYLGGISFAPEDRSAFLGMLQQKSQNVTDPETRATAVGILARFEPSPENLKNVISELGQAKTHESVAGLLNSLPTNVAASATPGMESALLSVMKSNDLSVALRQQAAYMLVNTTRDAEVFRSATAVLGRGRTTTTY